MPQFSVFGAKQWFSRWILSVSWRPQLAHLEVVVIAAVKRICFSLFMCHYVMSARCFSQQTEGMCSGAESDLASEALKAAMTWYLFSDVEPKRCSCVKIHFSIFRILLYIRYSVQLFLIQRLKIRIHISELRKHWCVDHRQDSLGSGVFCNDCLFHACFPHTAPPPQLSLYFQPTGSKEFQSTLEISRWWGSPRGSVFVWWSLWRCKVNWCGRLWHVPLHCCLSWWH